jgi:glucose/arabinose dehydrogenase
MLIKNLTFISIAAASAVAMLAAQLPQADKLPPPYATPSVSNNSRGVARPNGAMPKVPAGFTVRVFADNVAGARTMIWAPNGDLFVAQMSQGTILVLRDTNNDGLPDQRFVYAQTGASPFGLAFHGGYFYVGLTNSLVRYKYSSGDTQAKGMPEKLVTFPTGGHSTRNVIFNRAETKMYVSIGSASNIDENGDPVRAAINEFNPDGTGPRIFASGLRNPVGLALFPGTDTIWTAVNERDELGDDLVPDYATSVKDGGFYGWPYSYIGNHLDPRIRSQRPDLAAKAIVPDILIPAHSAAVGIAFYTGAQFPAHYQNGAFIALHGSWNRSKPNGYKVVFVPFQNGRPVPGAMEDFLSGFLLTSGSPITTWGRPSAVAFAKDGSLLVSDDLNPGGRIWQVSYNK